MVALLTACSSSAGEGGGAGTGSTDATAGTAADDTSSDSGADDGAALHLEGKVDRIVTMLRPGAATRPPDGMFPDATLLAARHVLRAPTPDGFVELWILRVRSPDMGPGIVECRVTESAGSSGASCSPIEGQALIYLDEACPNDTTVAAWRGEEQIREEPAVFC